MDRAGETLHRVNEVLRSFRVENIGVFVDKFLADVGVNITVRDCTDFVGQADENVRFLAFVGGCAFLLLMIMLTGYCYCIQGMYCAECCAPTGRTPTTIKRNKRSL